MIEIPTEVCILTWIFQRAISKQEGRVGPYSYFVKAASEGLIQAVQIGQEAANRRRATLSINDSFIPILSPNHYSLFSSDRFSADNSTKYLPTCFNRMLSIIYNIQLFCHMR